MNVTRYEPWKLLNQLQRELERDFGKNVPESSATAEWTPAFDIKEEPERYLLLADLPGVDPRQIDVTMENGILTVKGERTTEAKSEAQYYKRVERVYGSFYRRFSLPDTADSEGIVAKYTNGVLEIVIPKKTAVLPKKVTVSVESQ